MPTCFDLVRIRARVNWLLLKGKLSESNRIRLLRTARSLESFLGARSLPWPSDVDLVHEWVCALLVDHKVETTITMIQYARLILEYASVNPVRSWHVRLGKPPLKYLLPGLKPPPRESEPTFICSLKPKLEAFVAYRRTLNRAAVSLERWLRRFDRYLHEHQVDRMEQIDIPLLEGYRRSLGPLGMSSQRGHLRSVHQFLRYMHRNGETEVTGESVVALPMGTLRPKMAYIYTLKQIGELLRAVKAPGDWNAFTVFTMLHLMYAAGLRLHEPIKLRIQDVNLKSRTIFIERSKFGKSRRIPIGKRALQYLRAYAEARRQRFGTPKRDDRFFVNRLERPMNPPSVYNEFRRGRRQARLLNVQASRPPRVHDLRHSFAVHRVHKWYADGENPQSKLVLLSIYMGHREVTYTAHYLQMGAEALRLGGQGFQAAFEDLAPEDRGD